MLKVVGASWVQTRVSWWLLFSITLLGLVALYFGPSYSSEPDGKYAATVYYGMESKFRLEYWGQNNDPADIKKGVARGFYQPDISKSGWATLEVETQESFTDEIQACAAGMLEGALSWQMILHHWQNTIQKTCAGRQEYCARARDFLRNNAETVRRTAERFDAIDPFWHQVNLFYIQLDGIEVGWRSGIRRSRREFTDIPQIDFLWMNVMPDLRDLERRFNGTADFNPYRPPLSFVLLKYFPENPSDFILTHASAGTYNSMLRVQKRYNFAFHSTGDDDSDLVNGQILTFSSYPGTVFSGDDFYQVRSAGGDMLTVVGTELRNQNFSAWSQDEDEPPVLMGPRVMAANRLSRDGDDWSALFTRRNSGTGNKQWLILDTSDNFTAWAVEQMPGLTHAQEVTQRIVHDQHWIACGIPYFQDILAQSDGPGYGEGSSLYHLKNVNPLCISLKKYVASVTSVASAMDVVRSYDISVIGRTDLNGNSNLYGYLNVTHSISRHHSHHHRSISGKSNSEALAESQHTDIHHGNTSAASFDANASDQDVDLQNPSVRKIPLGNKGLDAGARDRTNAFDKIGADFHSAHYYEHRQPSPPVMKLENSHFVVDMKKDLEEIETDDRSGDASRNKPSVERSTIANTVDAQYKVRHKYSGVYAQGKLVDEDSSGKKSRDFVESFRDRGTFKSHDYLSNKVAADMSNELNISSTENQPASSAQSPDNGSDSQRSQNTSLNSSKQFRESGSLSSSDVNDKSSSAIERNYQSKKLIQILRAQKIINKSKDLESNTIETKISSPESYSENDRENSSNTGGSKSLETKLSSQSSPQNQLESLSETFSNANSASKSGNHGDSSTPSVDYKVERVPKIDIQFKSSKHFLHNKPSVETPKPAPLASEQILHSKPLMGDVQKTSPLGSFNLSKQFRGIIDVKISQGNGDFVAISGPPYYRPKLPSGSNLTASVNLTRTHNTSSPSQEGVQVSSSREARPANVDPFQWSKSYIRHQKHVGHPDLWNFDEFQAIWVWS